MFWNGAIYEETLSILDVIWEKNYAIYTWILCCIIYNLIIQNKIWILFLEKDSSCLLHDNFDWSIKLFLICNLTLLFTYTDNNLKDCCYGDSVDHSIRVSLRLPSSMYKSWGCQSINITVHLVIFTIRCFHNSVLLTMTHLTHGLLGSIEYIFS